MIAPSSYYSVGRVTTGVYAWRDALIADDSRLSMYIEDPVEYRTVRFKISQFRFHRHELFAMIGR
ncbi:hypothetical protein WS48_18290 [Burkholderia sp. RF7-non_BP1]|nr:hypothetical protein WS45_05730 [Burkholderia sp. RF2-non_BP3]KUY85932.1 hypothetical protein WS46_05560 [Burkholderia sp. RF4-BP95]KUY92806.1 hypothetical protein WS49_26700 [Burkholderia sp. RF7-non_BP4]KUY95313.1 hypothetical protein WS48_18290 [Burkholderia sp. RF7-non_BP1]